MKTWAFILLAAFSVAATACASASPPPVAPARAVEPPAPPPVDPVGIFDFTTSLEGTVVNGTVTIVKTDAGFGGSLTTNVTEPVPVRAAVVEGQKLTVIADTPDGPVVFTMEFKGDEFTGGWSLGTMSGSHSGKRRKA